MSRWDDPTRGFDDDREQDRTGGEGADGGPAPSRGPASATPSWDAPAPPSGPRVTPVPTGSGAPLPTTGPDAAGTAASPGSRGADPQGTRTPRGGFRRVSPGGVPELWPGPIPLRPMQLGEMLETALAVLRFNPRTMFGLSFLTLGVITVLSLLVAAPGVYVLMAGESGAVVENGTDALLNGQSSLTGLASSLLAGVLIAVVADTALGRRLTFAEAWARIKSRILPLVGFVILQSLLILVVVLPVVVLAVVLAVAEQWTAFGVVLAIGIPLTIAVGVWLWVSLSLAPATIVLERSGPVAAFGRSIRLVRGGWWRTFGVLLTANILTGLVASVIMLPVMGILLATILGGAVATGADSLAPGLMVLAMVVTALASLLVQGLVQPFSSAMIALVYLDRRFRTEALAVDLLAEAERDRPLTRGDGR